VLGVGAGAGAGASGCGDSGCECAFNFDFNVCQTVAPTATRTECILVLIDFSRCCMNRNNHTQNKGYNSTYSHNGLSFEGALLDAMLLTKEGKNVIIGGIDESIPILDDILTEMKSKNLFSSGSSFFNLSPNKKSNSLATIFSGYHF
jgi:hypothetical protein